MEDLIDDLGEFRTKNVGIVKGSKIAHLAPSGKMVNGLMKDLFNYLKNDKDILLIKSCVFHYEFEFIHPFVDGNGRMGRLWQTLILIQQYQVFEYLPVEGLIKENQTTYYNVLSKCDKIGTSTLFIEFMLDLILQSLENLLQSQNITLSTKDRIELYKDRSKTKEFSRKDYLLVYKEISSATASRDLKWALDQGVLEKSGEQRNTKYKFKS